MTEKSVFCEAWSPELTSQSFPVPVFSLAVLYSTEVKFDAFGTPKHGKGKSLWKNFFAVLISTLGRFDRANKKNLSYTL